ncbi:MAG TPA: hypothetical protein VFD58_29055 [Blastocatellia bacterium]|nr:hypothetical protein [Blastocatellia bacterium]
MKRTMIATIFVLAGASLLTLVSFASGRARPAPVSPASTARAQQNGLGNAFERARTRTCSPGTMEGRHGYTYSGTVIGVGPVATAGPISFDGAGNLHATYIVSINGVIFEGEFTGTYTVNADCTGSVTLLLPRLGIELNGSFVIVNNGSETFFTGKDAGYTITGTTKKIAS